MYGQGEYTNPHAATQIHTSAFDYDQNGNLTVSSVPNSILPPPGLNTSPGFAPTLYTWSYKNELLSATQGSDSTSYAYDHTGARVKKDHNGETTVYPSTLFNTTAATTTKHIYAGDTAVATITTQNNTPNTTYLHHDHLGSTRLVTDASAQIVEATSYYPFGTQYDTTGSFSEQRKYTGHEYDAETNLSYMGARYYAGERGRFMSQDPVSLSIGNPKLLESKANIDLNAYLRKPQLHNSYSYAGNNPVKYVDKNGEFVFLAIPAAIYVIAEVEFTAYDVYDVVKTLSDANSSNIDKAVSIGGAALGLIAPGGGYSGADDTAKFVKTGLNASDISRSANSISSGHAFQRHVVDRGEFTDLNISSQSQFRDHISNVLENPTRAGDLKNGRSYAYDSNTNTLVIRDPNSVDGGTAFRPERGEKYVDELR